MDSVRQWVVGYDHMHARRLVELNACYETGEKVSILSQDDSCKMMVTCIALVSQSSAKAEDTNSVLSLLPSLPFFTSQLEGCQ